MERDRAADEVLVELARAGDREAFDALFGRYLAMIRGEARRWGLESAEGDVVQETFVHAYLGLAELKDPGKFASWLRVISQRICISEMRAQRRDDSAAERLARQQQPGTDHQELRQLLAALAPEHREPLHLHYLLGLDTHTAAKAMGLSPSAFRVRLHRARRRARALARSQQLEEMMIMSGESRSELARRLSDEAHEAKVISATSAQDWPSFRAKMEQAYQANPNENDITWYLGRKLVRDGEYREAIKVLQPLWDRAPDSWTGIGIGWCLDYLGRREEAVHYYARVAVMQFLSETMRRCVAAGIEAPQTPKTPPTPPKGLVEIQNTGWQAAASHEHIPPHRGVDGDVRTCWTPEDECQQPGMWFRLDLGTEVAGLAGIWLDDDAGGQGIFMHTAPRRCVVSVSRDGEWWKRVADWRWQPLHYMEAWWEPVSARYLMLEQTEYCRPEWWCIYETHLFRAD